MAVLHVVSLPHTQTTKAFEWCAYTAKVRKFSTFMTSLDHEVFLYAGDQNEADCKEHVSCLSEVAQKRLFTERIPPFDPRHSGWMIFAAHAVAEIRDRAQSGDYLCLIGGTAQAPIAGALPELIPVEFGVGYGGVFTNFRCFESQAWMHTVYGATMGAHAADGRFYDTVIPNSFEVDDFPAGDGDGGYLLYMGRLIDRKGLEVVRLVAERTGLPLVVAGDGDTTLVPQGAEYVGVVGPEQRAELMGAAVALLAPTLYVEPFGGVAVEAQLTGTPAITTPWGAFTETVEHGRTGFRCHSLADFCHAAEDAVLLPRDYIRERAISLYSTNTVRHQYAAWFAQLDGLKESGWYGW